MALPPQARGKRPSDPVSTGQRTSRRIRLQSMGVSASVAVDLTSGDTHGEHVAALIEYCQTLPKA